MGMGDGSGSGSVVGVGGKRAESVLVENWGGGFGKCFTAALFCVFHSHFRFLTEMEGRLSAYEHVGAQQCVCLWLCFVTESDSYSHFKFKKHLLLSLNSKVLFVAASYSCS